MFSPLRVIVTTALTVAVCSVSFAVSAVANAASVVPTAEGPGVGELADALGMSFGIAVDGDELADADYQELVAANATAISTRDELSFAVVQPRQGRFDFRAAEAIVDFAVAHDLTVRGHDLIAPDQLPAWLTEGTWDATSLTSVLTEHVNTVVTHFAERNPGVITDWDVAARAVSADGTSTPSVLQSVLGDGWIATAFEAAHGADPDATLLYDDFFDDVAVAHQAVAAGQPIVPGAVASRSTCDLVPKCVGVSTLVGSLIEHGAPIDGVGFESRLFSAEPMDFVQFSAWVTNLGLEWAVTEFDVPLPATEVATAEMLDFQAETYRAALTACVDATSCDTFITWGIGDRFSPVPDETGGVYGGALWFDADDQPKPAYSAIHGVLAERVAVQVPPTTEPTVSDTEAAAAEPVDPPAAPSDDDASSRTVLVVGVAGALALVGVIVLAARRRGASDDR